MGTSLFIVVIALTLVNWYIYHKIFSVYYVGGLGKGLLKEFIGSWILAFIEIALFKIFFQSIGGVVLKIIMVIFRIVIIIAIIVAACYVIKKLYDLFRKLKEKDFDKKDQQMQDGVELFGENNCEGTENVNDDCDDENIPENIDIEFLETDIVELHNKKISIEEEAIFCTHCGRKNSNRNIFCTQCGTKM